MQQLTGLMLVPLEQALHGLEADRHHRRADFCRDRAQRLALLVHADDVLEHLLLHRVFNQPPVGMDQVTEGAAATQETTFAALTLLDGLYPLSGAALLDAMEYAQHLFKGRTELWVGEVAFEVDNVETDLPLA